MAYNFRWLSRESCLAFLRTSFRSRTTQVARPLTGARRQRTLGRLRRKLIGFGALLLPAVWIIGSDLWRRGRVIKGFNRTDTSAYLGSLFELACFWGVLLYVGSRRRGVIAHGIAALFVVLFTLTTGVEAAFFAFHNAYLTIEGQLTSTSIPWAILGTLPIGRTYLPLYLGLSLIVALGIVRFARRFVRPRLGPLAPLLVLPALAAVTLIPVRYHRFQAATPDILYFHGLTGLVKEKLGITHLVWWRRVQRRHPEPVPRLSAAPARPRNVLFLLGESVRADVVCVAPDPNCTLAGRFSNAALPDRMPLLQMRSNSSSTVISLSNLWSAVRPTESSAVLHSAPLFWDYAHAAGYDTGYWTSQHVIYGNMRFYVDDVPLSRRVYGEMLDPVADWDYGASDALLVDRVIAEWGELREPFAAVVQFANTHSGFVEDRKDAPFQPSSKSQEPKDNALLFNRYQNAVYRTDREMARLIRAIRSTERGRRTVLVYTSDHGESFCEHLPHGHTSSAFEPEVRVPAWIDAPPGTLSPEEEANLKGAKSDLVWHLDLATTLFDLLGVWDDPAFAPFRARMPGHPLTRPERTTGPMPMANCTPLWDGWVCNWGLMQGPLKALGRKGDESFHCYDVLKDPTEADDLGEDDCGPVLDQARALYPVLQKKSTRLHAKSVAHP